MSSKTGILKSYRELVFLARRLPKEKQLQALTQAKFEIRANKDESDQGKASDMHKKLVGKVGFLRMTLPKQRDRYTTSGTFVLRDGTLVEDTAYRENRVGAEPIAFEEGMKKHQRLMRRQYYGQTPPPMPQF